MSSKRKQKKEVIISSGFSFFFFSFSVDMVSPIHIWSFFIKSACIYFISDFAVVFQWIRLGDEFSKWFFNLLQRFVLRYARRNAPVHFKRNYYIFRLHEVGTYCFANFLSLVRGSENTSRFVHNSVSVCGFVIALSCSSSGISNYKTVGQFGDISVLGYWFFFLPRDEFDKVKWKMVEIGKLKCTC